MKKFIQKYRVPAEYGGGRMRCECRDALLDAFGPQALRAWRHGLGIDTFVGASGRVFPTELGS